MRVLQVMESTIGGTRRHIVDLTRGLVAEGIETHLVVSAEREPLFRKDIDQLEAQGAVVTVLPMVREIRPVVDHFHCRDLKRLMRAVRPDIVHTHSSKAGVLGRVASMSTKIGKRVHTPHTFAFLFSAMFSGPKRMLYRRVESFLGARTDRLVAVSESEAATIRAAKVVPSEIVRVVPNGIDCQPWMSGAGCERSELGVPDGVPLAIVAGLLNSAKGQDLAIRALAEAGLQDMHLLLAGHGEWRGHLEALVSELSLGQRVHFLGWRNDLPALFGAADLALVPSRWEGMPYVVLEAGASALPVVGTRVDGVRDLICEGQTGFLAELESPADLARALRAFMELSPADRSSMGQAGRLNVQQHYGVEAMVAALLKVYDELL